MSCFSVDFFEWCVECHIVLYHQPPLLNPDPSFVGLSRCVFSNVVFFRVHPRPKLSVEVSRDDSDVFFVVAVRLDVFLHLLDVHVRVSRMGEVDTGQFDFVVIALISRGDHPFTGVLCLNPSLPTLVQEKTKSMFLSSSTCTHMYMFLHGHMLIPRSLFVLVSMFRTERRRPICNRRLLKEAHRIDLRYSSISLLLYHGKRCLRMISFLPFFCCCFVFFFPCCRGGGSCHRCGVHCSCASVAKCSSSLCALDNASHPPPAVSLVRLIVVISFSYFTLSVLAVCLFCKMLIGTSPSGSRR